MTNKPPITTQCSLFIPNIYDRWSLIHLYILALSTSVQSSVQPASCRPFYFTTGPYRLSNSIIRFRSKSNRWNSTAPEERMLQNSARAPGASTCSVFVCVCLKNFHGIIFSFISKGYPTKIMILYLNLWVIKNIIFVKFNQMCVEILEILKQNSNKK